MAIRVAVVGAKGRMGQELCRAIDSDKDLELVAQIDLNDSLTKAVEGKADVIVDFTNATAAAKTAEFAIENGIKRLNNKAPAPKGPTVIPSIVSNPNNFSSPKKVIPNSEKA